MKTLKNFLTFLKKSPIILGFSDEEHIFNEFAEPIDKDIIICYASYEQADYEGYATVFYYRKSTKRYYECHGSHCSCYGLENQWTEEMIEPKELVNRLGKGYLYDGGLFKVAFEEFKKG
jgi:hypothetical protein